MTFTNLTADGRLRTEILLQRSGLRSAVRRHEKDFFPAISIEKKVCYTPNKRLNCASRPTALAAAGNLNSRVNIIRCPYCGADIF